MAEFIDLTHPLADGQLHYPGDSPIRITLNRSMSSDGVNVRKIELSSHQGTHLDAPSHFLDEGTTVDQIPLGRFFGAAQRVDLAPGRALEPGTPLTVDMFEQHADAFVPGAKVIYRTGWYRMFGQPEFFTELPSLTLEAAEWIAARRIGLLGMDTPTPSTIAGRDCHRALLAKEVEIVIVEGLANLDRLPERFTFVGFPLNLAGGDGSPIRAVAVVE